MKRNPAKEVKGMVFLLGGLIVICVISSIFGKEKTPEWFFAVMFLFFSMVVVSAAIKHMVNRIEELETKLQINQIEKEAL